MPVSRANISWSEELRLSRATVITLFLLPIVICVAAHALMLTKPDAFWQFTNKAHWFGRLEQRPLNEPEWAMIDEEHARKNAWRYEHCLGPNHVAKIAVEVVTAFVALQIAWHARRRGRPKLAALYLVVAVGAAVVAAEEARWGETFGIHLFPDSLTACVKQTNRQAELTLHNQPRVENLVKLAMSAIALYTLIGSLLVARRRLEWLEEKAIYLFIPHPVLIPAFAVVLFYSLERLAYKWITGDRMPPLWSRLQEPTELVAVLALLIFCWLALRTVKRWPRMLSGLAATRQ